MDNLVTKCPLYLKGTQNTVPTFYKKTSAQLKTCLKSLYIFLLMTLLVMSEHFVVCLSSLHLLNKTGIYASLSCRAFHFLFSNIPFFKSPSKSDTLGRKRQRGTVPPCYVRYVLLGNQLYKIM